MTVSYRESSTIKLLLRWKGSIWKSVWKELLLFYALYFSISFFYRYGLNDEDKRSMDVVVRDFNEYLKSIPITFLLGFYVTSMVSRWWGQFQNLVWPDTTCAFINLIVPKNDPESRKLRRVLARYLILSCVLAWREVSSRIRKRFPTCEHIIQAGLMTRAEYRQYQAVKATSAKWMLPLDWIQRHAEVLLQEGKLAPPLAGAFTGNLNSVRTKFRHVFAFDWVAVPLIYTQVAALATYSYFLFCLVGRQFLDTSHKIPGYELDIYIPVFTTLQFLFYVGWFKVGQDIMRPFGEDEDDFELNYILDRHIRVAFTLVDTVRRLPLPDVFDPYNGCDTIQLPHTLASSSIGENAPTIKTDKVPRYGKEAELYKFVNPDTEVEIIDPAEERRKKAQKLVKDAASRFRQSIRKKSQLAEHLISDGADEVSVHSLAV